MKFTKSIQTELKSQKMFHDGWLVGILVALAGGLVFMIGWSITHVQRSDIELPVRFTSLSNFDQLGLWYRLYEITGIAAIIVGVNLFLALLLYRKNRILSIFLLVVSLMVVILAIAILLGFTVIKYGAN